MIFLDTNYIIRYLTRDNERLYKIAYTIFNNPDEKKYLTANVIAESIYVLVKLYGYDREIVSDTMMYLIEAPSFYTDPYVLRALGIYKNELISIYDALILSECLHRNAKLYTFDKKLQKVYMKYA